MAGGKEAMTSSDGAVVVRGKDAMALLADFTCTRVLAENTAEKYVNLLGTFSTGEDAPRVVMRLERAALATDTIEAAIRGGMDVKADFHNDIYAKFQMRSPAGFNDLVATIVYPATDRHVAKHSSSPLHMIYETPEIYRTRVEPFIDGMDPKHLEWVRRILRKEAEVERCILDVSGVDAGFAVFKDMKWDGRPESLYATTFSYRTDIRSLRDLNQRHLPLLRAIRELVPKALEDKFNVPTSQIRLFVHYQPSYYHFHVHCTHVSLCSRSNSVERAHLLNDIIENISMCSDYYQRRTLSYSITEDHGLFPHLHL